MSPPTTTTTLPAGRFGAILADPPWPYATYSARGKGRSAEAYYDTMSIDAIVSMPVASWAADDCVLLLWVTDPVLPRAFDVITVWASEYKTVGFTRLKARPEASGGLRFSYGARSNPEPCLLAIRGHPKRRAKDIAKLIVSPRREHSRKPDEIYDRIERLVTGPYLELFGSAGASHRDGWTRWVGKDRAAVRRWRSDSYPGAEVAP
jgi:N6-adenosine-specific RNA methylase IME4